MNAIGHTGKSLVDILRWRAEYEPDRLGYEFLEDGENLVAGLTYEALDKRARAIAARLQGLTKAGDRALLLLPAGLDFIAAYFGCLYGKVIAIPVRSPHVARLDKSLAITLQIAVDAGCAVTLVNSSLFDAIQSQNDIRDQFDGMELIVVDSEELAGLSGQWQAPEIGPEDIAFLQYTSGSTSSPKGVMVSHGNLLHNLGHIEESFGQSRDSRAVIWLPPYHDMGLIGGILQPLYTGNTVTLIPPWLFLQRPIRWLQAISRVKATTSGGPNFAYELCVSKVKPEQREQLDLSDWEVAFNGAEPVNHATLERFANYFAPCGFRKDAFLPCFGLAEATLMVTGGPKCRPLVSKHLLKSGIKKNRVIFSAESGLHTVTIVSCGRDLGVQKIRIVNPETRSECHGGEIGEIWLSGPSVAKGYWNKTEETEASFTAYLSEGEDDPYLRTGDLGFVDEGELYITGRMKNLIIIDGKNHYPHDIERTVEGAHPSIQPSGCAVFSITESASERIVVFAEVHHRFVEKSSEIEKAIRLAVNDYHEVPVHDIRLGLAGSIPRTTSGKIRHFLCKQNYISETLQEFAPL